MHAISGTIPWGIVDCVASTLMRIRDVIPPVPFNSCLLVFGHSAITRTRVLVLVLILLLVLVLILILLLILVLVLDIEVLDHLWNL